ncbi:hypothetical protein M0P98_03420 [bacterium]|nr:hypothetical protein [bacterium]
MKKIIRIYRICRNSYKTLYKFNKKEKVFGKGLCFYFWYDLIWSISRFGCTPDEYLRFEFYKKSHSERDKFLTARRVDGIVKNFNTKNHTGEYFDKGEIYKIFSEFISRKWLDTRKSGYEEFRRFIIQEKEVFFKPSIGAEGVNISKYSYKEGDDLKGIYTQIKGFLIEEVIKQNKVMELLHPSSVNTIRVVAFLSKGEVEIIGCYVRMGISNLSVDNISLGGMVAAVDIKTGVVYTPGITKNLEKYLIHPLTGVQIIGFKIPNWENVIKTVKKAHLLMSNCRYLGWDIAILGEGVELVEVNWRSGISFQMTNQRGLYEPICKILKNERKN